MTVLSAGFLLMALGLGGVFLTLFIFYFFIVGCAKLARRTTEQDAE